MFRVDFIQPYMSKTRKSGATFISIICKNHSHFLQFISIFANLNAKKSQTDIAIYNCFWASLLIIYESDLVFINAILKQSPVLHVYVYVAKNRIKYASYSLTFISESEDKGKMIWKCMSYWHLFDFFYFDVIWGKSRLIATIHIKFEIEIYCDIGPVNWRR